MKLPQSLTQAQEERNLLSKKLQALQEQMNSKKPAAEKSITDKKQSLSKSRIYCWTHGKTRSLDRNIATCRYPKKVHQVEAMMDNRTGGSVKWYKEDQTHENYGGSINTLK